MKNANIQVRGCLNDSSCSLCVPIFKSIHFIGLRSSKDCYKQPDEVVGVCRKGHLGVRFLTWVDV